MLHNDIGEAKLDVKNTLLTYNYFDSPWSSLFKSFMMFIGEIDYNNIPIGISYGMRHGNISVILAYLFLLSFIFLISVVLVNLLNGLAVSDTGEIMRESLILHECSRIDTISYFEMVTLSNLSWIDTIGKIFPLLDSFLKKYIAVVHKGIFIFHSHISPTNPKLTLPLHLPNDIADNTSNCFVLPWTLESKVKDETYGIHEILNEARDILIRNQMEQVAKSKKWI